MEEGIAMELDFDMVEDSGTSNEVNHTLEIPSEKNLVPKIGAFLGLDISERSTGVTEYFNGIKTQFNIALEIPKNSPFQETLARRDLKSKLLPIVEGKNYELIIIEDVFEGENPSTARGLYAINTAIDELILDEFISCKEFVRVNNKLWKKWLSVVDSTGVAKGYNDKVRIQMYMEMLGITDSGEGFQDRLDSNGLILGYLLNKSIGEGSTRTVNISFNDLEFAYLIETSELTWDYPQTEGRVRHFSDEKRWSKDKIVRSISQCPEDMIITSSPVVLSLSLGNATGCTQYIEEGGYFAFWVKKSKIKKYMKL